MPKDEKKAWQGKVFGEIANHLKNYPFLLIALAAILTLSLIVVLDIEKLRILKTLLMVVIVLPIVFQFIIEFTKLLKSEKEKSAVVESTPEDTAPEEQQVELFREKIEPAPTPLHVRKKTSAIAIVGLFLPLLLLIAIGAIISSGTFDSETALGTFLLSSISMWLALIAILDIKRTQSRGHLLALIGFVLSVACVLASVGVYTGQVYLQ